MQDKDGKINLELNKNAFAYQMPDIVITYLVGGISISYLKVKASDLYQRKGIMEGTEMKASLWKTDDHTLHDKFFPKWYKFL